MLKGSVTLLFVSHSRETVRIMCGNVPWLNDCRTVMGSNSDSVCAAYEKWAV